ncbi:YeiH family protein [Rhizobium oryzicola]|uniref:YeiH family protein n=1 Tax=Rhizobium oryzicola TaxID=1232668 RepID=A0ABT8SUS2_9HYPH|nr:YeiH family protein [Rhizobium oryzicola]MDO1582189.1 YeiH family protein [Rhizobium oryzicola]
MLVRPHTLESHHHPILTTVAHILPGLALTGGIAAAALAFRAWTGIQTLSPLILSIVIGMVIGNIRRPHGVLHPGLSFSLKRLLRIGIILLGLQITLPQLLSLGLPGVAVVTLTLAATFVSTMFVGRLLGVDRRLTGLIAAGTSVCGASAVIAANAAIRGRQEDVAYAVACVTIFGSISMLLFPLLMVPLHLSAVAYGVWSGATIHEVAQVVAATFQSGEVAGQFGTIAKLARVVLLAPLVMTLALTLFRAPSANKADRAPFPWFVIGFLALVVLNSLIHIPASLTQDLNLVGTFLLSCGLAAMGLQTHVKQLAVEGLRPLALGAFGWVFISVFGFMMVKLAGF